MNLAGCPVVCTIAHPGDEREVRGFRREEDFERWVRAQPFAAKHEEAQELVRTARAFEHQPHEHVIAAQEVLAARVATDLADLSDRLGLPLLSRSVLDAAHHGPSLLEAAIVHSAVLFDNSPQGTVTGILPTGVPVPSFAGGNDRTSQLDVVGAVTTLWDKTWWRGDRAVFYGVGLFTLFNSNFDNRAASGLCI